MITSIKLSGLNCAACQKVVEKRIKKITGVSEVKVNLENGHTEITAERQIPSQEIKNVLSDTDYKIIEK